MTSEQVYILVTYDGSATARAVFEPAARIAKRMQANVVIVRVHHAPAELWVHPEADYRERELGRLTAEWQGEMDAVASEYSREYGVAAQGQARLLGRRWNIPGEILAVADEFNVETICMATHGEGSIRRVFIGSTALDVVSESKRPVTLIRAGEEAN
jgi:nucleotide-binding universal stress UspA family protein